MGRIAEYYERVGDTEISKGNLEKARDAYGEAAAANSLLPEAQRKFINTKKLIQDRDNRLVDQRGRIATARDLTARAESAGMNRNYAHAIGLLREATQNYTGVTDEFAPEYARADSGLRIVRLRLADMKKGLIENAQRLSGTGFARDVRELANIPTGVEEKAFRHLLELEYRGAMKELEISLIQ